MACEQSGPIERPQTYVTTEGVPCKRKISSLLRLSVSRKRRSRGCGGLLLVTARYIFIGCLRQYRFVLLLVVCCLTSGSLHIRKAVRIADQSLDFVPVQKPPRFCRVSYVDVILRKERQRCPVRFA